MGVILKWKVPDLSEVTYDEVYIYRATSKEGTYDEIASQAITDNTYFDADGTSSHWYKVRFHDSTNDKWSAYSLPIAGGKWIGYCTPDDVRLISNITTSDVSDSVLYDLISFATIQINHEVQSKIIEEVVAPIDSYRSNSIDGSNTTFYVSKSFDYYIGDMNDDGVVDINDVVVYEYKNDGTRNAVTVTSVSPEEGKFVLATPPSPGSILTVTYVYSPVSHDPPNSLLTQACAYLTAGLVKTRLDASDFTKISLGKLSVFKGSESFVKYYNMYNNILNYLKSKMMRRVSDPDRYFISKK